MLTQFSRKADYKGHIPTLALSMKTTKDIFHAGYNRLGSNKGGRCFPFYGVSDCV